MHSYLVAAGSNLGNRQETIECARAMIIERGRTLAAASDLVVTAPFGSAEQIFLNGAK